MKALTDKSISFFSRMSSTFCLRVFTIVYSMLNSRALNTLPCRVYPMRGAPRERGRAYGEAARPLIQGMVEEHLAFLEFSAAYVLGATLTRAEILQVSDQYLPACERFASDLVDEVRGIAEASNVPFAQVFSLNTFIDLADMVRPETAGNYLASLVTPQPDTNHRLPLTDHRVPLLSQANPGGCTSFGAMAPATRDGKVYLGQTFDTKAVFEPYICALELDAHNDVSGKPLPSAVVATFAGIVGCAGINSSGVCIVINHLHTHDARPGVPFPFAVRKMLQAKTADAALELLTHSGPASGIHYLVGDDIELRGAETSATRFEILAPRDGILSHANHCHASALQEIEISPTVYSLCRGNRAQEMLAARSGQINAQTLFEIASDHIGADDTICSHAETDAPRLRQYKTDFAVILSPAQRTMDLFVGSPCEGKVLRTEVRSIHR